MSWWLRALIGYSIGSLFHMPLLGFMIATLWSANPSVQYAHTSRGTQGDAWYDSSHLSYHETRWVQGFFSALAVFAKAKGSVTEDDIQFAEQLMQRWRYNAALRQEAIAAFRRGKESQADAVLQSLCRTPYWTHMPHGQRLLQMIHIYLQSVHGSSEQKQLYRLWAEALAGRTHRQEQWQQAARPAGTSLVWAFETLGVTRDADAATVKKAFRKMMSKHHPDRNPSDPKATERTQKIQKAYTVIKQAKGWS